MLSFLTPLVAKIVALAMALASVVGTGALAANGELPVDIQDKISDLADDLGIKIPSGDDLVDDAEDQADQALDEAGDQVDNVSDTVDDQLDDVEDAVDQDDQNDDAEEGEGGTKQHPHCDDEASQQAGKRSNYDVHQAICSTEPGPERGQAVSAAARQKPAEEQPNTEQPGGDDDQESDGETQNSLTQNGPGGGNEGPKGKALGQGKHQGR